jgi:hypothetical protein
MYLVNPVHRTEKVGLSGPGRAAPDVDTAHPATGTKEYGASGGMVEVGVVAHV